MVSLLLILFLVNLNQGSEVGLTWETFPLTVTGTVSDKIGRLNVIFEKSLDKMRTGIATLKSVVSNY